LKFGPAALFSQSSLPHGDFQTARQLSFHVPFGGPLSCTFILMHGL